MAELDIMIERARQAMAHAYAPYSGFAVGACLRARSGQLYSGCNVENASYPEGQCAEASAIGAMITAGDREIVEVVVIASSSQPCPPCGGCRQRLREFARPETPVHLCDDQGVHQTLALGELLPASFSRDHLVRGLPATRPASGT